MKLFLKQKTKLLKILGVGLVLGFFASAAFLPSFAFSKEPEKIMNHIMMQTFPEGETPYYGKELNLRFEKNTNTINRALLLFQSYDPGENLTFDEVLLKRYTTIGSMISCEYCCGAQTLVFSDGSPACACNHSAALRGALAYLLEKHGDHFSNDDILRELQKWKALFFPKQTLGKALKNYQEQGLIKSEDLKKLPEFVGSC